MDKEKHLDSATLMYELGYEAYKARSLAMCVKDALLRGDFDPSAYAGGLETLCDKTYEVSVGVDALYARMFGEDIGGLYE